MRASRRCGATMRASPRWRAMRASASCSRRRPGARTATGPRRSAMTRDALADVNRRCVALMAEMRAEYETARSPMVISGNIGPRGDGYNPGQMMSAEEAEAYHAEQINVFARDRGRLRQRVHAQLRRGGDRRGARGASRRHAGGDLVHGRDRRQAADRAGARGRDQRDRCGHGKLARLLHAQLRASDAFRRRARRGRAVDADGCAACAPMRRRAAMPSSTPRPISMPAIRSRSAGSIATCAAACGSSPCSAAAAAPTTATSSRSASPARRRSGRWRESVRRHGAQQLRDH